MLQLYRRHNPDCPFSGKRRDARGAKGCKSACPIWVQGSLRGEYIRKALNLRSWEAASDLVRGWEASGIIGVVKPDVPTVAEAVTKFFADATARQLSKSTICQIPSPPPAPPPPPSPGPTAKVGAKPTVFEVTRDPKD